MSVFDAKPWELTDVEMKQQGEFLSMYDLTYKDGAGHEKVYEVASRAGSKRSSIGKKPLSKESLSNPINPDAVIILAISDSGKVLLCREFRFSVNQHIYNLPAGLRERGETYEETAARELREETGVEVTEVLDVLHPTLSDPGVTDDSNVLVICRAKGKIKPSDSVYEPIEAKWCSRSELANLLEQDNTMFSSRTQGIIFGALYLGNMIRSTTRLLNSRA